jgi:hypothetical protein
MLTPVERSVLVVQTWFAIGVSPIIVFFSGLYAVDQFEPAWLLLLPASLATQVGLVGARGPWEPHRGGGTRNTVRE